jgi:hypothetical protein
VAHPLAAFYASAAGDVRAGGDLCAQFRAFCGQYQQEIRALVATRLVQTNEVQRSACLLPGFTLVAAHWPGWLLALVEIGASAGLNLLWDRYGYHYGDGGRIGDLRGTVQITCALKGDKTPPLPAVLPRVAYRAGIDLHPIDVRDADETLWLRALVWPEHDSRAALLERAIALVRQDPPRLVEGDALAVLPAVLADVPPECGLCIFESHAFNQFAPDARERLLDVIAEHVAVRDLALLSLQGTGAAATLALTVYQQGAWQERLLARCDGHGRWMEWLED